MRNLLPLIMFLIGAGAIVGGYALIVWVPVRLAQRRIEARVAGLTLAPSDDDKPASASILKRQVIGLAPILDRLAARMRWGGRLAAVIDQSG